MSSITRTAFLSSLPGGLGGSDAGSFAGDSPPAGAVVTSGMLTVTCDWIGEAYNPQLTVEVLDASLNVLGSVVLTPPGPDSDSVAIALASIAEAEAATWWAASASEDINSYPIDINMALEVFYDDNIVPVAEDGTLSCSYGTANSDFLVATDADSQPDPLAYSIVADGLKGAAVVDDAATGAYTYTPTPGESGIDTFTFKANDGAADSNEATITVTIDRRRVSRVIVIN